jgi:hypothetical protein
MMPWEPAKHWGLLVFVLYCCVHNRQMGRGEERRGEERRGEEGRGVERRGEGGLREGEDFIVGSERMPINSEERRGEERSGEGRGGHTFLVCSWHVRQHVRPRVWQMVAYIHYDGMS